MVSIRGETALAINLLVRRLVKFPTAMGRSPPAFLFAAIRRAPQRKGDTEGGTKPLAMVLTNLVSCVSAFATLLAGEDFSMIIKCSGRRPLGPAAVPLWKDREASRTCVGENDMGEVSVVGIGGGGLWGCLDFISLSVAALGSASPRETRA